ncbi:hypothetical protein GF360_01635 [candidate division WWE3 bacterium]|nr:hypothetical protein [candidate division WWE3 bacterium]
MNTQEIDTGKVKNLIENAQTIAVVPSEVAGADSFSAAAGLYYTLQAAGKDVSLVYIGNIPAEAKGLIDAEKLTKDIYARQLSISIDYSDTPASKLAYSNEDNVLKLVLSPISKDFDRSKIKTRIEGNDFDLILVLGVQSPDDLGIVYKELQDDFAGADVVNIDNTSMNLLHGDVNFIDTTAANLSELVFKLLSKVGLVPNGRAAKALLVGMTYREPQE